jgi:hypothetical protein
MPIWDFCLRGADFLRKKMSAAERLARRPGPSRTGVSKPIRKSSEPLNPRIGMELNAKKSKSRRGAPKGNRNALKHGRFTREHQAFLSESRTLSRQTRGLLQLRPYAVTRRPCRAS